MRGATSRALSAYALLALVACRLERAGAGEGASANDAAVIDATTDAPLADASSDDAADAGACTPPQVLCLGACVASCQGCNAGEALCPSTRACGRCGDGCPGSELECFTCTDGGGPVAFCSAPSDKCAQLGDPCPCAGGTVESCPGQSQVCAAQQCKTCGEDGTDTLVCGSGRTCAASASPPACR